jgi:hypothetical protein
MIEELTGISKQMQDLLPLFQKGTSGMFLPTEHSTTFKALAIEAKSILDEELGHANDYSLSLIRAVNGGAGGFMPGPSYASVEEASKIIEASTRALVRKRNKLRSAPGVKSYVDSARILALNSVRNSQWDFARLIELCREINVAAANRCHMSTAMLLRTILNHVPPALGFATFAEVANNYGGPKERSFKASMQRLELSLRNIADLHLHSPIRSVEDIPSAVQVDFAADLDVLLGEIARVHSKRST